MGNIEDLFDERRQSLRGLVDPLQIVASLTRLQIQMQERVGVPANKGQRSPELMTDRRDEPLAELIEGPKCRDVAQDRRGANPTAGVGGGPRIPTRHVDD